METPTQNTQQNPQKQRKPRELCELDGSCPNFPLCKLSHPTQIQMQKLQQQQEQNNMNQQEQPQNQQQQPQQQHNYNFDTLSTNVPFNDLASSSHTQMHSNQSQSTFGNQENTNQPDQNQTPSHSSFQPGQNLQHQLNQPIQNNESYEYDKPPNRSGENHRGRGGHSFRGRGERSRGDNRFDYRGRGDFRDRGGFRGDFRGDFRGGYRGDYRGGFRADDRGGFRGGDRGGFRGGDRVGFRGGERGGFRGDYISEQRGNFRGDYRGDQRGEFRGRVDNRPDQRGDHSSRGEQRGRGEFRDKGERQGRGKRGGRGGINPDLNPNPTNSQDMLCPSGDSCQFNKQGKCCFRHEVIIQQNQEETVQQSQEEIVQQSQEVIVDQDDDSVCPYGPACGDPDCQKEHRRRQRSLDSSSVGGSSSRSKLAGLCHLDMVCQNETCVYVHSTESKRSPAFELRMMLNGVKDYGQISSGQSHKSGRDSQFSYNNVNPNSQIGGFGQYPDPGNYIHNPHQQYPPQVSALPNQFIGIGGQPFVVNQVYGMQPGFGSTGVNPMAGQQIFAAGMNPPMSLQEQQLQQQLLLSQQTLMLQQQELQRQKLELQSVQGSNKPNQDSPPQNIPKAKMSQQKQENKELEQQQKVQNIDTLSYPYLEKIYDSLCIKTQLEDIKSSNKAFIEYQFTTKACKIKLNKDIENWEKVKEQVSQTMPFSILFQFTQEKSDDYKQLIQQFLAKNKNKLKDRKVVIISDEDFLKMKQQNKTEESKRKADKAVHLFGQRAKNEDVQYVRNLLKKFYKKEFPQNCSLFYGCKKMDISTRTHIYRFLKQSKKLDDILKNQGFTEKLEYDDNNQNINVIITINKLEQIQHQVKVLLDSVITETIKINHNIVVHKTQLPNLQTLKKKVEEKFNVIITETIQIYKGNQSSSNAKKKQIDKKQPRWKYNNTPQDRDTHLKKEYEIQVTGAETKQAINYINRILDDYQAIEPMIKFLKPEEFNELKYQLKAISLKYQVLILFRERFYLVGRQSKNRISDAIQELQKAVDNIQLGNKVSIKAMQLTDAPNVILMKLMRAESSKVSLIESQNQVSIEIDRDNYIISGNDEGIAQATQDLAILEQTMLRKIVNIQITEQNRIDAIKMKGAIIWEKERGVQIVCLTMEEAKLQQEKKHLDIINFNQQSLVERITYQWSYKFNNGDANYNDRHDKENDWFDYDLHQNNQIEQHYQQCCQQGDFKIVHQIIGDQNQQQNGIIYHVSGTSSDPSTWTQKDTQTGYARPLQRKELKFMGQQNNQVRPQQLYSDQIEEVKGGDDRYEGSQKNYFVKGLNEKVDSFLQQLDIFYQDPNNHTMILSLNNFKKIMNANNLNQMKQITQLKFNCNFAKGFSKDSIKIIGLNCFEAGKFFENLLDKAMKFEFPNSWEQIDQHILKQKNLIIIPLAQGGQEWINIENQFKVTMPQANILTIERIQNKKLWRNFKHALDDITDQWGKQTETHMLYHGTKQTPPEKIYDSEEGFNMQFSSGGMWGKAIYFSQNSSYSNNYSSQTPQNTSQMFFARVLVGNYAPLPPSTSIKMPPIVQGDPHGNFHDSIKGNTGGSDVFMIYANNKAYPEYLITYQ
eukprot:403354258